MSNMKENVITAKQQALDQKISMKVIPSGSIPLKMFGNVFTAAIPNRLKGSFMYFAYMGG